MYYPIFCLSGNQSPPHQLSFSSWLAADAYAFALLSDGSITTYQIRHDQSAYYPIIGQIAKDLAFLQQPYSPEQFDRLCDMCFKLPISELRTLSEAYKNKVRNTLLSFQFSTP